jgi:hypothetical protein
MRMPGSIVCMWIFAYAAIKVARIVTGNWDHQLVILWPSAASHWVRRRGAAIR